MISNTTLRIKEMASTSDLSSLPGNECKEIIPENIDTFFSEMIKGSVKLKKTPKTCQVYNNMDNKECYQTYGHIVSDMFEGSE